MGLGGAEAGDWGLGDWRGEPNQGYLIELASASRFPGSTSPVCGVATSNLGIEGEALPSAVGAKALTRAVE